MSIFNCQLFDNELENWQSENWWLKIDSWWIDNPKLTIKDRPSDKWQSEIKSWQSRNRMLSCLVLHASQLLFHITFKGSAHVYMNHAHRCLYIDVCMWAAWKGVYTEVGVHWKCAISAWGLKNHTDPLSPFRNSLRFLNMCKLMRCSLTCFGQSAVLGVCVGVSPSLNDRESVSRASTSANCIHLVRMLFV